MSVVELSGQIQRKEISPVEVVQAYLRKIEQKNPELNAFITVCAEEALAEAKQAEAEIARGEYRGVLHGVPVALKDLIETRGVRTTMGSQVFADFVPETDATVVRKLRDAGAIVIGKTNTHEFAYGPTGDKSYFGAVKNPYDTSKMSGGSSSGSGSAVGGGLVPVALGTDTGGSIRIPSAACGVVGMKPTFGRVSKQGVFPLAYTLDHIGPMTQTVLDNAHVLNVLAGFDPQDSRSVAREAEDFTCLVGQPLTGRKVGVPMSFYFDNIDPEILVAYEHTVSVFRELGAEIVQVQVPDMNAIAAAQVVTIKSEASAVHRELLVTKGHLYDPEVRERLEQSRDVLAYEYVSAQEERGQWIAAYNQVFEQVDILLTPTLPILAPDLFAREIQVAERPEAVRNAFLRLTAPTNYLGNPSLSLPVGLSKAGLPIGMQLIGAHFAEALVYQFAAALEAQVGISKTE